MKKIISLLLILVLFSVSGCNKTKNTTVVSLTENYFDTPCTITIYEGGNNKEKIIEECFKTCKYYDSLFNKNLENSDIDKINQYKKAKVSDETIKIIKESIKYSKMTDGLFDITIGPLVELWDIKNNKGTIPSAQQIDQALKHVDYKQIKIKNNIVKLSKGGIIDLGAIAKGYVTEKLKTKLKTSGVTSAIINLGGNIYALGNKNGKDFKIGIQKPFAKGNEYVDEVNVNNKAVVTSGIYQRYFKKDNKIYSHIISPKTGYPIDNEYYSSTIISDDSICADALSTATIILGINKSKSILKKYNNIHAIFLDKKMKVINVK